jgi:hypothetical protein
MSPNVTAPLVLIQSPGDTPWRTRWMGDLPDFAKLSVNLLTGVPKFRNYGTRLAGLDVDRCPASLRRLARHFAKPDELGD